MGGLISSFAKGTPFVPKTQLAMVHQGEAIIPAEYNTGGFVGAAKFLEGGEVNPLKQAVNAGKEIGKAIVEEMEKVNITLNVPDASDLPTLKIGDLDKALADFRTVFEGGSVGADRTSKLDQFIDSASNKFDRLEEQTVDTADRITIVEARTSDIAEIGNLKLSINNLEGKIAGVYTAMENRVDSAIDNSYMESRLHEIVSDLKTDEILPIRSNINRVELIISDLGRDISEQYDIIYSNINRLGLV